MNIPPRDEDPLAPDALTGRIKRISRRLRQAQMALHQARHPGLHAFSRADIYFEPGPGGAYPIVALRSLPCAYFLRGNCVPCGYSARPRPTPGAGHDPYPGLLTQVDDLLGRFDALFVRRSAGRLPGYRFRHRGHERIYMLQLAGESSFFSDREIPPAYRLAILERFHRFSHHQGVDWHLMVETRPEDLLKAAQSGELARLQPLLESLNVVVNMGFEHEDDFLRQVIFAKELDKGDFLRALAVAHQYGLDPGVFLFAGGFILTPAEALQQLARGLAFLASRGAFVNVMLPNLQACTLPDLLYEAGHYELPEPPWLMGVMDLLLDYAPRRPDAITPGHWFVGGLVAEPPPVGSIMAHPRRRCPAPLARQLLRVVRALMAGEGRAFFEGERARLANTPGMPAMDGNLPPDGDKMNIYADSQAEAAASGWPQRTHHALTVAEQQLTRYLNAKRNRV